MNPVPIALTSHERRGINALWSAGRDFEPPGICVGIGSQLAEHLVSMGLAEAGPSEQDQNRNGYRLTELGRETYLAGPPKAPKSGLRMASPTVPIKK